MDLAPIGIPAKAGLRLEELRNLFLRKTPIGIPAKAGLRLSCSLQLRF